AILPVLRSIPARLPHGGARHGIPSGDTNGSRLTPYGVPYIGCTPISVPGGCRLFGAGGLSSPRGINRDTKGIDIGLAMAICRGASTAMPPHSNIPKSPGNTSVPCSEGGV